MRSSSPILPLRTCSAPFRKWRLILRKFSSDFLYTVLIASNGPHFGHPCTCKSSGTPYIYLLTRSLTSAWDCFVIAAIYKTANYLDAFITPEYLNLPHPYLYSATRFALWALYSFWTGLFGTGLWVIAHECGHQAFSESKFINNSVGWVLHSAYAFFFRY